MLITGRKTALDTIWRETHRDYRGHLDGERSVMTLRNNSTVIVPFSKMTDADIAYLLAPKHQYRPVQT